MCLAIPAEVLSVSGDTAQVSLGGVKKTVSIALLDDVEAGDYVLIHVGYALSRIDEAEAKRALDTIAGLGAP